MAYRPIPVDCTGIMRIISDAERLMAILYHVMKPVHKTLPLKYKLKVIALVGWICGAQFVLYLSQIDRAPMTSSDHAPCILKVTFIVCYHTRQQGAFLFQEMSTKIKTSN